MTNQNKAQGMDIFSEYVRLRQSGWSMEDAVRDLQPLADQLSRGDRQQLGKMVQTWEAHEGANYKGMPKRQDYPTIPSYQPPPGAAPFGTRFLDASKFPESMQRAISPQGNPAPTQNPIRPIQPLPKPGAIRPIEPMGPASDPNQRKLCPNCGKPNHVNDTYCYACGHILEMSSKPSSTKALDENIDPKTRWGTAHFGQFSSLLLQVRGASKAIEVPQQPELIIGRSAPDSAMRPDIDLAAYNAEALGVSRLHAALKRQEHTISITDLDSKNYTYINGQRLHSHEVRVLRDGDEVRLGKLIMKVGFKHQIRRL